MRPHRRRRAIAIVACVLWLCGVEALPALHLAGHTSDHSHARDGTIVSTHPGEHRHGSVVHSHAKPRPRPRRQTPALAFDEPTSPHAASGLAHHAIAYPSPPAPLLAPLAIDQPSRTLDQLPASVLAGVAIARPQARGPPA